MIFKQDPQGRPLIPKMEPTKEGTYNCFFVPDECGPYNVSIKYDGKEVNGAPFELNAYPIGDVSIDIFAGLGK